MQIHINWHAVCRYQLELVLLF